MKHRLLIVCLFTIFGASSAFAASPAETQATAAMMQAKMGSKAKTLKEAQTHLQRIVNCLVGKDGVGYDGSVGGPCMGNGAMNDFKGEMFKRTSLERALQDAQYGLMTKRVQIARNAADLAINSLTQFQTGD